MDYVSPFDPRERGREPLAGRPGALHGRRVALLDINNAKGGEFLDRVEELLESRGASTFRVTKATYARPASADLLEDVAVRGDLAVQALAD